MKHWRACTDSNYFKKIYPEPEDEFLPEGRILPPPNSSKSERPYLRGFFDFETMHSPQNDSCGRCLTKLKKLGFSGSFEVQCPHLNEQKTVRVTELPAICFNLLILDEEGTIVFEEYYQGVDAAAQFSKRLFAIEDKMMKIIVLLFASTSRFHKVTPRKQTMTSIRIITFVPFHYLII